MCKKLAFPVFCAGLSCLVLSAVAVLALHGERSAGATLAAEPCSIAVAPTIVPVVAPAAAVAPASIAPVPPADAARLPATGSGGFLPDSRPSLRRQAQPCPDPTPSPVPSPTPTVAPATIATAIPDLPDFPASGGTEGGDVNLPPGSFY